MGRAVNLPRVISTNLPRKLSKFRTTDARRYDRVIDEIVN